MRFLDDNVSYKSGAFTVIRNLFVLSTSPIDVENRRSLGVQVQHPKNFFLNMQTTNTKIEQMLSNENMFLTPKSTASSSPKEGPAVSSLLCSVHPEVSESPLEFISEDGFPLMRILSGPNDADIKASQEFWAQVPRESPLLVDYAGGKAIAQRWPKKFSKHVKKPKLNNPAPPKAPPFVRNALLGPVPSLEPLIEEIKIRPKSFIRESIIFDNKKQVRARIKLDSEAIYNKLTSPDYSPKEKKKIISDLLDAKYSLQPQMFGIDHNHSVTLTPEVRTFLTELVGQFVSPNVKVNLGFVGLSSLLPNFDTTAIRDWSIVIGSVVLSALTLYYQANDAIIMIVSLFQMLVTNLYKADNYVTSVVGAFCVLANSTGLHQFRPQMDSGFLVRNAIRALLMFMFHNQFANSKKTSVVDTFLDSCSTFKKYSESATFTVDWALDLMSEFMAYISERTGLFDWKVESSSNPEICEIVHETAKLSKSFLEGAAYNWDMAQCVFALKQKLELVYSKIPNNATYNKDRDLLNKIRKEVDLWIATLKRNNVLNNGPRFEPLGILIGGGSGVGKSTGINALMLRVTAETVPESMAHSVSANYTDHVWSFCPENPYADGYHNQWNTFIDEFGALLPVKGAVLDGALSVIRFINTVNTPMHMAELADKGSVNFSSPLVWATTNANMFRSEHLRCPKALTRRFRVSVIQVVKPEYATENSKDLDDWLRVLDRSKVPPITDREGNVILTTDHVVYVEWDFEKGCIKPGGKTMSYEELVAFILKEYRQLRDISKINIDQQKILLDKALKNRFPNFQPAPSGLRPQMDYSGITGTPRKKPDKSKIKSAIVEPFGATTEEYFYDSDSSAHSGIISSEEYDEILSEMARQSNLDPTWVRGLRLDKTYRSTKDFFSDIKEKFLNPLYTKVSEACDVAINNYSISDAIKPAVVLTTIIGAMSMFWYALKGKLELQSGGTRIKVNKPTRNMRKIKEFNIRNTIERDFLPQGCFISRNTEELAEKLTSKSIWELGQTGSTKFGHLLFYKGKFAMGPAHYLLRMFDIVEANSEATFTLSSDTYGQYTFKLSDFTSGTVTGSEEDVCYYHFPHMTVTMPDITASLYDGEAIPGEKLFGALIRRKRNSYILHCAYATSFKNYNYGGFVGKLGYTYRIATKDGECGLPFVSADDKLQSKVLGFHVAGDSSVGISVLINKQDALGVMKFLVEDSDSSVPPLEMQMSKLPPQFTLGNPIRFVPTNSTSKVIKSPLYEQWGPSDYAPALLRETLVGDEYIDPWYNARSNYCTNEKECDPRILSACVNLYSNEISENADITTIETPRILTFEEACEGIPGKFKGIPRKTSAGYPLCLDTSKKTEFFGFEGTYEFEGDKCQQLKKEVSDMISLMEKGVRPNIHYVDFLKDERRPKEKVQKGSTRLVSASALKHLIVMRMYFGHFSMHMTDSGNRIHNGVAIGMNPYSLEWQVLYNKIHERSVVFAGDYSKYDGSETKQMLLAAGEVSHNYYYNSSSEAHIVRDVLLMDVYNSKHTYTHEGVTCEYEWNGGMPSGCFLTGLFNTIVNNLIVRYSVIKSVLNKTLCKPVYTLSDISTAVLMVRGKLYMIAFGDDNIVSLDECLNVTPVDVANELTAIGMKYTNADKTEMSETKGQVTFLKRSFKKLGNRIVGPLELAVVLESPYWTKKGVPIESQQLDIDTTFKELSLHGKEIFETYATPIVTAVREKLFYYSMFSTYELAYAAAIVMEAEEL